MFYGFAQTWIFSGGTLIWVSTYAAGHNDALQRDLQAMEAFFRADAIQPAVAELQSLLQQLRATQTGGPLRPLSAQQEQALLREIVHALVMKGIAS